MRQEAKRPFLSKETIAFLPAAAVGALSIVFSPDKAPTIPTDYFGYLKESVAVGQLVGRQTEWAISDTLIWMSQQQQTREEARAIFELLERGDMGIYGSNFKPEPVVGDDLIRAQFVVSQKAGGKREEAEPKKVLTQVYVDPQFGEEPRVQARARIIVDVFAEIQGVRLKILGKVSSGIGMEQAISEVMAEIERR